MDPVRVAYKNAKQRCLNKNHKDYKNYGGRGIKFLFDSFQQFKECLGFQPHNFSLDRINNEGHYEPSNVRWAAKKDQIRNRRIFVTNSSGVKGVHYKSSHGAWVARGGANDTRITLYHGKDFFAACCARKSWDVKHG